MSRTITDITGKKFGMLTVDSYAYCESYAKQRIHYWNCTCDCGAKTVVRGDCLRSGNTKSCGCLRRAIREKKPYEYYEALARKRAKKIAFNGKEQTVREWSNETGLSVDAIYRRLNAGMSPELVFSTDGRVKRGGSRKMPRERYIKINVDGEELTFREASKKLGIPEQTLRQRRYRSKKGKNNLTFAYL